MSSLRCFANTACSTAAPYRCRSHFDHVANPSFALWRNFFNVALSMSYLGLNSFIFHSPALSLRMYNTHSLGTVNLYFSLIKAVLRDHQWTYLRISVGQS